MARNGHAANHRPSAFQAGHIPSWHGSCECYALSPVAAVSRWSLLLLSPLLSLFGEEELQVIVFLAGRLDHGRMEDWRHSRRNSGGCSSK
jgi:hypothetical protein